jgi:protein O-mannosyl-transferase
MIRFKMNHGLFCLVISLIILIIYSNSVENPFLFDDFHVIFRNPSIKNANNYSNFFSNPTLESGLLKESVSYRPLLMVTFALNYSFGAMNPFGYHLLNIFIHMGCAIFVYFIILFMLRLSNSGKESDFSKDSLIAFFGALLFAVHPVQTESVTLITGRSSSLMALFFLGSFCTYLGYVNTRKFSFLLLSSAGYCCALLAKEVAITLVVLLSIFMIFFPLGRSWRERLYTLAPYIFLTIVYVLIRIHFWGVSSFSSPFPRTLYENLLTQTRAWVFYLKTLILPINLSVVYDFPISHSILEGQVLISILILSSLFLIFWKISQSYRIIGFFALWFAITISPTNSLISQSDVVTDRWLYLSSVGYAVILAVLAGLLFKIRIKGKSLTSKIIFFFLCALVVELYGYGTALRNFTWANEWMLWEDAALKSPNRPGPHNGLGLAFANVGRFDEAIEELKRAIEISPYYGGPYLNLGVVYYRLGRYEEAIQAYQKAISLDTNLAMDGHNNLGVLYTKQGETEKAITEFQKSIEAHSENPAAYYNLWEIYYKKGNIDEAILVLEKVIQFQPEYFNAYGALALLYEKKGWKEKSREAHANYIKYVSLSENGLQNP